jgi:hypothetical protein
VCERGTVRPHAQRVSTRMSTGLEYFLAALSRARVHVRAYTHITHTRACSTDVNVECFARALSRASFEPALGALARLTAASPLVAQARAHTAHAHTLTYARTYLAGLPRRRGVQTEEQEGTAPAEEQEGVAPAEEQEEVAPPLWRLVRRRLAGVCMT